MSIDKKIRLGINTLFLVPGDVGGTETFIRETLKALHRYHRHHMDLVLFTNHENDQVLKSDFPDPEKPSFVKLKFRAANRPKRILLEQFWLPFKCRKADLDLLWSPGYTAPFWSPCAQTVTIPDLQYKSFPEDMSGLERIVLDVLVRMACRRCDAVFTISEFSRQEVIRFNFAEPGKIHPALLGVDVSFAEKAPDSERKRVIQDLLSSTHPYILCVAHSYPHKNIHLLVEAFKLVSPDLPHNLVIVGKPRRGEGAVIKAAEDPEIKHRIFRLQGLPYKTLQMLYQDADMFVLPSAYEGFGLPVIEAMMAGVPVITSREGSLTEVGGTHAYYIPEITPSAIAEQIKNVFGMEGAVKEKKIHEAKRWAQLFTWKRSADEMVKVFETLLSL